MATIRGQNARTIAEKMKIGISLEATRVLRDTWHSAINHEWYEFLKEHTIHPLVCHSNDFSLHNLDLVILCGGNDMPDIVTWRNNNYPVRDAYEHKLIDACLQTGTPHVGICRGSHFINWVMGGTHCLMTTPYDNVSVSLPGLDVVCHHTIQIDQLAPGFEVLLKDSAGVVELAIHKDNRQLLIGWHPERAVNAHTRPMIMNLIENL